MFNSLTRILRSPDAQAAPSGGPNGAGAPVAKTVDPRGVLAAMVAQQDLPASPEPESPATAPATAAPAETDVPPTEVTPGQEALPAETQPPGEEQEPAPADEPTEPDSPSAAPKDEKPSAVQKRIDALTAQKSKLAEENEALKARLAEKEAAGSEAPSAPAPANLPAAVAKLKTVAECETRLAQAETQADAIQDFLDANPGDATTEYQFGEHKLSRQELIDTRAQWRAEIKAIPRQAHTITQQGQFQQMRQQAHAAIVKDFPVLADPEHPDTKVVQQLLKDPRFQSEANGDYLALAFVRGHQVLQAELQARAKGKPAAVAQRPAGAVPAKKPMTAAGGSARPDAQAASLETAVQANGKSGSRNSFAAVLAASGR